MKDGQTSQTAIWVCMARALAHGRTSVARFSDPTALTLLPDAARTKVEATYSASDSPSFRERLRQSMWQARAGMMVARTVEIDDAIRAVTHPQLVILGAGLDGRAWRMPELRDTIVFEVDHPDSQRTKRARISTLTQTAREVRFVPVNFTRDSLDDALTQIGHDPSLPTTWVWEGVIMYLTPAEIESTLAVITRRSTRPSRLIIVYLAPALMMHIVGILVRRVGEPFRSSYTAAALRDLLADHGFAVHRDENVRSIATSLSPELGKTTRRIKHLRVATADRLPAATQQRNADRSGSPTERKALNFIL
jgi:methyltransferase (TIGR00027 family)